jgi:anti-sigma-K factor RskA
MKCTRTVDAGAYVLGALAPTDRAAYERHMAGCVECRNEVAELAVLPGLLGRLDAATAVTTLSTPPAQAPAGLLARILHAATTERRRYRRRHRWQLAVTGIAAACLAMALGLGVMTVSGEPRPTTPVMAQMTPVDPGGSIVALVGYAWNGRQTDINITCLYENQSPDTKQWWIDLTVVPRDGGQPHKLASWPVGGANPDDSAQTFTAHTDLAPADIKSFQLTNDSGTPLLWLKVAT